MFPAPTVIAGMASVDKSNGRHKSLSPPATLVPYSLVATNLSCLPSLLGRGTASEAKWWWGVLLSFLLPLLLYNFAVIASRSAHNMALAWGCRSRNAGG